MIAVEVLALRASPRILPVLVFDVIPHPIFCLLLVQTHCTVTFGASDRKWVIVLQFGRRDAYPFTILLLFAIVTHDLPPSQ